MSRRLVLYAVCSPLVQAGSGFRAPDTKRGQRMPIPLSSVSPRTVVLLWGSVISWARRCGLPPQVTCHKQLAEFCVDRRKREDIGRCDDIRVHSRGSIALTSSALGFSMITGYSSAYRAMYLRARYFWTRSRCHTEHTSADLVPDPRFSRR